MIDNEIIHSRPRLLLMIMLASVDKCNFSFLKTRLGFSDGVLSVHLQKLEKHSYVSIHKSFLDRRPNTDYKLTRKGLIKLLEYIEEMENLFSIVKEAL